MKKHRIQVDVAGPWFKEGQWCICLIPYFAIQCNRPDFSIEFGWLCWSVSIVLIPK